MSEERFSLALIPLPSPDEEPSDYGEKSVAWQSELDKIKSDLLADSSSVVDVKLNLGHQTRWRPISPVASRIPPFDIAAPRFDHNYIPDWLPELVLVLSSPAFVTSLFRFARTWIKAKAGREIKIKFGSFEVDFKGMDEKKVAQLLQQLQNLAQLSAETDPVKYAVIEAKVLADLSSQIDIPSVPLKQAAVTVAKSRSKKKGTS